MCWSNWRSESADGPPGGRGTGDVAALKRPSEIDKYIFAELAASPLADVDQFCLCIHQLQNTKTEIGIFNLVKAVGLK